MLRTMIILTAALALAAPSNKPIPPSEAAQDYFRHVLEIIKQNHRNRDQVDWARLVPRARSFMVGAKQPSDTYQAIRFVLDSLHERHSFLLNPASISGNGTESSIEVQSKPPVAPAMPSSKLLQNHFGYLYLPELNTLGPNGLALGSRYAASLRSAVLDMDKADLCGFIVDLRGNGGGNMWPMLGGLDPLLGRPPFGFFVLPNGTKQSWIRSGGNIFPSPTSLPSSSPAFILKRPSAPIAILVGPRTASSGEMTAIAFIGRPHTRVFGQPSAGLTTANKVYPLTDGAVLVLTETTVQDRTGRDYDGPIIPDEQLDALEAETRAQHWLAGQCVMRSDEATQN